MGRTTLLAMTITHSARRALMIEAREQNPVPGAGHPDRSHRRSFAGRRTGFPEKAGKGFEFVGDHGECSP
jgi:hypothetical protein